ncbi:GNAT family N-acetyltransferase [Lactobacillus gallinarum]|uniref:GNAT family N-acetyltransferase n=1 Tax=Lactobacillus gallinarum TaxID=52242 RepID=A0A1Y4W3H8_9LACO|nr:GNAT family N-acetyltransferase [Lactobacillus gallinarum]OUQ57073.1 GNAT family N-acetyltransferase [Lactobacillus gallinarum]OUQ76942.1 GNAT family N-acetyltransferase [Lactobacillus gallinarum]
MKLKKNQDNLKQIASLIEYAFLKDSDLTTDANFMSRYDHSDGYGYFDQGKLTSYMMVNQFKGEIFGHHVPIAGIGYVSSYPECRGRGHISKLMEEVIHDLHENKILVANLAPFSEDFYRHYGFSNSIYQKEYRFSGDALASFKLPRKGKVLRGKWDDLIVQNGVIQLYERQLHTDDERNTIIREAWWWNRLDSYYHHRDIAVYFDNAGRPMSYLIYRIVDNCFMADELYSITPQGLSSILGFMAAHIGSVKEFCMMLPEKSLLAELFPEQNELDIQLHPYMMSRIIDFQKVLSCMRPLQEGTFNIEVNYDDQCPWNIGVWQLDNHNREVTCERKEDELVDFSGPITAWTQVLLGRLTLKAAIELGLITNYRIKKLDFVKGKVSFYDYF